MTTPDEKIPTYDLAPDETAWELDQIKEADEVQVVLDDDSKRLVAEYKNVQIIQDGFAVVERQRVIPDAYKDLPTSLVPLKVYQIVVDEAWKPKRVKEVPSQARVDAILSRIAATKAAPKKEPVLPPGGVAPDLEGFLSQIQEVWGQGLITQASVRHEEAWVAYGNWRLMLDRHNLGKVTPETAARFGCEPHEVEELFQNCGDLTPPDLAMRRKMLAIYDACLDARVEPPDEVQSFFENPANKASSCQCEGQNMDVLTFLRPLEIWAGNENNEMAGPYKGIGLRFHTEMDPIALEVRITDPQLTAGQKYITVLAGDMPLDYFTLAKGQYSFAAKR